MAMLSPSSGFMIDTHRAVASVPARFHFATGAHENPRKFTVSARGTSIDSAKNCKTCKAKGAIECPGCKGTGRNKKNGNIFERWKCFDCQGFGMKSCPTCGKGGLTPEQRGER